MPRGQKVETGKAARALALVDEALSKRDEISPGNRKTIGSNKPMAVFLKMMTVREETFPETLEDTALFDLHS